LIFASLMGWSRPGRTNGAGPATNSSMRTPPALTRLHLQFPSGTENRLCDGSGASNLGTGPRRTYSRTPVSVPLDTPHPLLPGLGRPAPRQWGPALVPHPTILASNPTFAPPLGSPDPDTLLPPDGETDASLYDLVH